MLLETDPMVAVMGIGLLTEGLNRLYVDDKSIDLQRKYS
jgi:hypothetical protein